MAIKWSIFFSNIFIHVAVMSLFLTVFFFTVASNQEKHIVENQVNFIMDDLIGNTLTPLPESEKEKIKDNLDSKLEDAKSELKGSDESVKKANQKTVKKAFLFVGIVFGILSMVVVTLEVYFKWNMSHIKYLVFSAFTGLVFVAITETLFLLLIAKGYYSVDPNKIKKKVVDTLISNSKK